MQRSENESPFEKDFLLNTREEIYNKDNSYLEHSGKSLLQRKISDDMCTLQNSPEMLMTDNESSPIPIAGNQKQRKHFTFTDNEFEISPTLRRLSSQNKAQRKLSFKDSNPEKRRLDRKATLDRLESIYTRQKKFSRTSTISLEGYGLTQNRTLTNLEKLLIADEPESSNSDISEDKIQPKENNLDEFEEDNKNDELNNSGDFPLEGVVPDMNDTDKGDLIVDYLSVKYIMLILPEIWIGKNQFFT